MGSRIGRGVRLEQQRATAGRVEFGRCRRPGDLARYIWPASHRFRAMQTYGLIVADNGSDMYISGAMDGRWNNDELNPAFRSLTAGDFEVVQLGLR